jgi:CRISPR-associated endoribonuclease Cas6
MPIALILTVYPQEQVRVVPHLNRATHAALLRLIAEADADLAQRLHDDDRSKPFTVSNVLGLPTATPRGTPVTVTPEQRYELRITLLTHELEALAQRWTPERIGTLDLDGTAWQVERICRTAEEHAWAGTMPYEELVGVVLRCVEQPPTRWALEFAAPVTFRQRGMNQPFPTPDLVFGSLLDKWNATAPLVLPDEVRRFAQECLATSHLNLRSVAEPTKGRALQVGSVGRCTYVATNRDRYWLSCIEVLAHFAFYSGVGAGTARGLGRARLLERRKRDDTQSG